MKFNLSLVIIFLSFYYFKAPIAFSNAMVEETTIASPEKKAALIILENHCNECHQHKKKKYVFTEDNMSSFATKIHQQVFVKKKMPKGRMFPLSEDDEAVLLEWLTTEISIGN